MRYDTIIKADEEHYFYGKHSNDKILKVLVGDFVQFKQVTTKYGYKSNIMYFVRNKQGAFCPLHFRFLSFLSWLMNI